MHKRLYDFQEDPKFINALDSFLKDYTRALREHIASKKEREKQQIAAETERQRHADMATQTAEEERRQGMAIVNAKAATARAETGCPSEYRGCTST